jgi:hypothetical protein
VPGRPVRLGPVLVLAAAALTGLVSQLYRPATSAILAAAVPGPQRVKALGVYQLGVSAGTRRAGESAGRGPGSRLGRRRAVSDRWVTLPV